ncbi:MAG: hypothetical protein VX085_16290, partial [Pseudomonadota bacterium]|nr:hypothetical protein [Pseudomonadota bacterium]
RQIINDKEKASGTGQNVMDGNPIGSITWLANHLKPRGFGLKAGDWISSGSAADMLPVPAGGTVTGDFGRSAVSKSTSAKLTSASWKLDFVRLMETRKYLVTF